MALDDFRESSVIGLCGRRNVSSIWRMSCVVGICIVDSRPYHVCSGNMDDMQYHVPFHFQFSQAKYQLI